MREPDAGSGWWQRNWGWCVGCGCLLPLLAVGALAVGGGWFATRFVKSNDALATSMELVNADPRAIEVLGTPIQMKLWRGGDTSMHFSGKGKLEARFPISGPNGGGRLEVEAHVEPGTESWTLDRLILLLDGNDGSIDLLEDAGDPLHDSTREAA